MNILFICNKSPYPPKEGGPIAMNMLIQGLIEAGHSVKVIAVNSYKYYINEHEIPEDYRIRTGIELLEIDLRVKPIPAFLNLFTSRSYHIQRFISESFRNKLISLLEAQPFDIVQLETLFVSPYVETIREHSRAKIVLRAHNIEHLIWERIAETSSHPVKRRYLQHLAKTLKSYELNTLFTVDGIAAITGKDADYFREQTCQQAEIPEGGKIPIILSIPFGIDIIRNPFPSPAQVPEPLSLFSIGAMNWIPNEEGIKWFLQQVWPEVHSGFPELNYYLAGREMPDWMFRVNLPNVHVVGEVENAKEFIHSKNIMIVPLFSGSGIRIKIIEGMAAGKTIISTTLGAEGIHCTPGKNILIANAPCEFFDMISWCVTNPSKSETIGKNAKKLIESEYNQQLIVGKLIAFYQELLA